MEYGARDNLDELSKDTLATLHNELDALIKKTQGIIGDDPSLINEDTELIDSFLIKLQELHTELMTAINDFTEYLEKQHNEKVK